MAYRGRFGRTQGRIQGGKRECRYTPARQNVPFSTNKCNGPTLKTDRAITLKHSMTGDMSKILACGAIF